MRRSLARITAWVSSPRNAELSKRPPINGKQAVALDPHDHQALYNLGDVLIRLGRPVRGPAVLGVLPARGPSPLGRKRPGTCPDLAQSLSSLSKKLHQDVAKMILHRCSCVQLG